MAISENSPWIRSIQKCSLLIKKMAADLKTKGTKPRPVRDLRRKAGSEWLLEFCRLHGYSLFPFILSLDVIQVLDDRNYFQSCQDKHCSLHVYCYFLSWQRVDAWIHGLAYIERITDGM